LIELKNFVKISKYAGERFDLVQAAGGNSSVKLKNSEMLIKASGFLLSDVTENNGYSKVDTKKIVNILKNKTIKNEVDRKKREFLAKELVEEATLDKNNRPSIETLLHSTLYKYTLHTHSVVVNMIVIQKEWKEMLTSIFKDENIALVSYKTPGIDLALELDKVISAFVTVPKILFLQNHGLIITSDNVDDIERLTELVLSKIEDYLKIDMSRYKLTNKISKLINSVEKKTNIAFLSEDKYLNEQLFQNQEFFLQTPFCPDSLVFCGVSAVIIKDLINTKVLQDYKQKYFGLPKVIIFNKHIFFIAANIKKAKEMEEVMKFHIMVLEKNKKNNKNFLEFQELLYLNNWEAENYRKKIKN
jgi:rhamnose utilization protein RhaD (predicted bifunctional aldolase and dehydrogenase)